MKQKRLLPALSLLCLLVLTALPAAAAMPDMPFAYADLTVNGLPAGATIDQTLVALGEPISRGEETTEAATGDVMQTLTYDGLTLTFTQDLLSDALFTSAAFTGPRGVAIGMDEAALNTAFPYDTASVKDGVLYAAGWVEALELPLPPCAKTLTLDDGTTMIQYLAPVTPYGEAVLESPEGFLYEPHAGFAVTLDSSLAITAMEWHVGALAE